MRHAVSAILASFVLSTPFALAVPAAGAAWESPAADDGEPADCALFLNPDRTGAVWQANVSGAREFAAQLPADWSAKATSAWVRSGFALEAYDAPQFTGQLLTLTAGPEPSPGADRGQAYDLEALGFAGKVRSYRCRRAAKPVVVIGGTINEVDFVATGRYEWRSRGNHPSRVALTMSWAGDQAMVYVYAENNYGNDRQHYTLNLTSGTVQARIASTGFGEALTKFDVRMAFARRELKLVIDDFVNFVDVAASGYAYDDGLIVPPAPELASLASYLRSLGRPGLAAR